MYEIHSFKKAQIIKSLLYRKRFCFRKFANSSYGPCYLLFHIEKYIKLNKMVNKNHILREVVGREYKGSDGKATIGGDAVAAAAGKVYNKILFLWRYH
jgi:hypothetical protein